MATIKLIECPRDAMQGLSEFIPTDLKAVYLNQLLRCGFNTLDFGSFVSPKSIPQMRDTADVLEELDLIDTETDLLAIIANKRGLEDALQFEQIHYLGYPFSISETFQKRNTNSSIADSLGLVEEMQKMISKAKKELVIYISMAFGNPYNDPWGHELVATFVDQFSDMGIKTVSLADTVGVAESKSVKELCQSLILDFPEIEFGAHFHARPDNWKTVVDAAYDAGITRFDSAINGYGGCPMADDKLVGNIATENLIELFMENGEVLDLKLEEFAQARILADAVFPKV